MGYDGRTRQRVRNPPRVAAAATTEATPSRKIGQLRPISAKMESGALRAITQPNIPCAKKNGWGGTRVSPIVVAVAMAAIMDPRRSAAGRCRSSKIKLESAERTNRIAHRRLMVLLSGRTSKNGPDAIELPGELARGGGRGRHRIGVYRGINGNPLQWVWR